MIFVVGARRSGTNWIQRILAAHPDVGAMPSETYLFSHAIRGLAERFQHTTAGPLQTGLTFMERDVFLDAARDFADRVFEERLRSMQPPATYLVERTPWHVYHLDLIDDLYPDSTVVHIIRDGRDAARSLLSKDWGPDTMEEAAEEWRSSVSAGRRGGASLTNYVEVFYEELLADPETGIRSLFERAALPAAPNALEPATWEARAAFNVDPRFDEVGTGKWRGGLSGDDLRAFHRVAGRMMEQLGYEAAAPAPPGRRERLAGALAKARAWAPAVRRPRAYLDGMLDRTLKRRSALALQRTVALAQRLQDELDRGPYAALDELLDEAALIETVDDGKAERSRGRIAIERLQESLASHHDRGLRPLSATLEVGQGMFAVVGTYSLDDGSIWGRTLVVTRDGQRVSRLILHRYRLSAPVTAHM